MEKLNIPVENESQKKFMWRYYQVFNFLKENFILDKEKSPFERSTRFITNDRSKLLKLIKGLKHHGFFQNDDEKYLEYSFKEWRRQLSRQHVLVNEMNAICFTKKAIVPSGRKALAAYITVAKSCETYIVSIGTISTYKKTYSRNYKPFDLSSDFTGSIAFAGVWSDTVSSVKDKYEQLQREERLRA